MRRERDGREHPAAAGQDPGERRSTGERILVYPTEPDVAEELRRSTHSISDLEIAQLVSVALEDAIAALHEPVPEIYIRLRACEAGAGIRAMLAACPGGKPKDPKMLLEYRRAMTFHSVALELALSMVTSIRRYCRACDSELGKLS